MKKFKIGEKVVALTNPLSKNGQPRLKGKIYDVLAKIYCFDCGEQHINICGKVKNIELSKTIFKCRCGSINNSNGLWWTTSEFFARPSELQAELEQAEMEERYEECAELAKIMAMVETA